MEYEIEIAYGCEIHDYTTDITNCDVDRHKYLASNKTCGNCKITYKDLHIDNGQTFTRINDNWIFCQMICPYLEYHEILCFIIFHGELNIKLNKLLVDEYDEKYMKYEYKIDEDAILKTLPDKYKENTFSLLRNFR